MWFTIHGRTIDFKIQMDLKIRVQMDLDARYANEARHSLTQRLLETSRGDKDRFSLDNQISKRAWEKFAGVSLASRYETRRIGGAEPLLNSLSYIILAERATNVLNVSLPILLDTGAKSVRALIHSFRWSTSFPLKNSS